MSKLLKDLWIVFGLVLGQLFLTFLLITCVPFAYWSHQAKHNPEVKQALEQLTRPEKVVTTKSESSGDELSAKERQHISVLFKHTPWAAVAVVGSLLIYPFLGWWSAKLLTYPQASGLIILISVFTRQNLALIPKNIEYLNLAPVSLGLPAVSGIVVLQFFLLVGGLLAQFHRNPPQPITLTTKGDSTHEL